MTYHRGRNHGSIVVSAAYAFAKYTAASIAPMTDQASKTTEQAKINISSLLFAMMGKKT